MPRKKREEAPAQPSPPEPEARIAPPGRKVWTRDEALAQEAAVEGLLVQNTFERGIIMHMRREFGVGMQRTRTLIDKIRQRWLVEGEARANINREAAVRRIARRVNQLDSRLQKAEKENASANTIVQLHKASAEWEKLLADIQGVKAPVKHELNVQVSQAILQVIATLSADDVSEMLAKQQEMERLAGNYKALLASGKALNGAATKVA